MDAARTAEPSRHQHLSIVTYTEVSTTTSIHHESCYRSCASGSAKRRSQVPGPRVRPIDVGRRDLYGFGLDGFGIEPPNALISRVFPSKVRITGPRARSIKGRAFPRACRRIPNHTDTRANGRTFRVECNSSAFCIVLGSSDLSLDGQRNHNSAPPCIPRHNRRGPGQHDHQGTTAAARQQSHAS